MAAVERTATRSGAQVVSNSFGADKFAVQTRYYASFKRPGVTIVASSGDAGFRTASFPAVAPGVIAIGGTSLTPAPGTKHGWTEQAWTGAGSGCSAYVKKPAVQTDTHCDNRTITDISAVADPATGLAIYHTLSNPYGINGWDTVGGTSLSAPLIAGAIGLAQNGSTLQASDLYNHRTSINDIVGGSNSIPGINMPCGGDYLCNAKRGYDGPTGPGTPRGIKAL